MSGLSKLGITLTSVFSLLLLALLAELLYLLWRRRQQLRRKSNRVEPTSASTPATSNAAIMGVSPASHSEFLKLQSIYGGPPSRVLFTIKEEEKDEIDTELSSSAVVADHRSLQGVTTLGDHFSNFHFQLSHTVRDDDDDDADDDDDSPPEVIIMVGDSDFDFEPPFLTPCTSPPYFTPSPSPTREEKAQVNYSY